MKTHFLRAIAFIMIALLCMSLCIACGQDTTDTVDPPANDPGDQPGDQPNQDPDNPPEEDVPMLNMIKDGVTTIENMEYWEKVLSGSIDINLKNLRTILNRYHEKM